MANLKGDIVNRVKRLPKPSTSGEALQPVFEAVSNALHAVDDRFASAEGQNGYIEIYAENLRDRERVSISINDNGIGLDEDRYDAFLTTDTDFKIQRGGKGVGRLLWLDAFDNIEVSSIYENRGCLYRRRFDFALRDQDPVLERPLEEIEGDQYTRGTTVKLFGLRQDAYKAKFPIYPATFIKHFASHFLADFLFDQSTSIVLNVDGHTETFPEYVTNMLSEDRGAIPIESGEYGSLQLSNYVFDKAASTDFDGNHQLHFVVGNRTVVTRKIDGLLGIGRFGENDNSVYHGCVTGTFLTERVNQERTRFTFSDAIAEDIARVCSDNIRAHALDSEISEFEQGRLSNIKNFISDYPSFGFAEPEDLLSQIPKNAVKDEQFAQALVPHRIRRDKERQRTVQEVVEALKSNEELSEDFGEKVRRAADEVRDEERRQLTEYVLRRKIVLEVLNVLIARVRDTRGGERDYHLESTLHQFICPMKIRGDDPSKIESADHNLWILDERLAFAKYFASDVPFDRLIKESGSAERPDMLIFDKLHGLGLEDEEPLKRVLLLEFKKPGRRDYEERYSPAYQIHRYLEQLRGRRVENFRHENIRIAEDCVFYCYVVADIVGALDTQTASWHTTANGRGRWTSLAGKYRGSIEIIEWADLLKDAQARNRAFIRAAGLGL